MSKAEQVTRPRRRQKHQSFRRMALGATLPTWVEVSVSSAFLSAAKALTHPQRQREYRLLDYLIRTIQSLASREKLLTHPLQAERLGNKSNCECHNYGKNPKVLFEDAAWIFLWLWDVMGPTYSQLQNFGRCVARRSDTPREATPFRCVSIELTHCVDP